MLIDCVPPPSSHHPDLFQLDWGVEPGCQLGTQQPKVLLQTHELGEVARRGRPLVATSQIAEEKCVPSDTRVWQHSSKQRPAAPSEFQLSRERQTQWVNNIAWSASTTQTWYNSGFQAEDRGHNHGIQARSPVAPTIEQATRDLVGRMPSHRAAVLAGSPRRGQGPLANRGILSKLPGLNLTSSTSPPRQPVQQQRKGDVSMALSLDRRRR